VEGIKIETSQENSRSSNWYLLREGHHTGPFTQRDLLRQIEKDEIKSQDRVWKQGLENWIQISDLNNFNPTPPSIPIVKEKDQVPRAEEIKEAAVVPEPKNSAFKYTLLLIPFIIIGFIYYYLTIPPKRYLPFARLEKSQVQRLNNLIQDEKFKGELTLSQDAKELWLATGIQGPYRVELVLNSVDGEILNSRKIRITSRATLDQNWARFHIFNLEYGTKIAPGKYSYGLIARPLGPKEKLDKFWKKFRKEPLSNEGFKLTGEILFTKDKPAELAVKLADFKKKILAKKLVPFEEKLEKWKAFLSVLTKVDTLYQDTLRAIKRGKSINLFENKYNRFLGSMLRSLVLETREVYKVKGAGLEDYKKLHLFGRHIGEMVSDMVVKTKKYKVLGPAPKGRLSRYFMKKAKGFKERAEKEIGLLVDKIKSFEQF